MPTIISALLGISLLTTPDAPQILVLTDGTYLRYVGEAKQTPEIVIVELEGGGSMTVASARVDWPASERATRIATRGHAMRDRLGEFRARIEELRARSAEAAPRDHDDDELVGPPRVVRQLVATRRDDSAVPPESLDAPGAADGGHLRPSRELTLPQLDAPPHRRGPEIRRARLPSGRAVAAARSSVADLPSDRSVFVSPRPGEAVCGPTLLDVRAAAGSPVRSIEFRVNGRRIGTANRDPFRILWQAPLVRADHDLTAILRREDGSTESIRGAVFSVAPDAVVDVELVPLQVTVTDTEFHFVLDLEPEDFRILEDGVPQPVAHFSHEPVALSIFVLVDLSFSMSGAKFELALDGVLRLVELLAPVDRIGLGVFDETLRVLAPVSFDRAPVVSALEGLTADGGTGMFDCQTEALTQLGWEDGRRVLVVLGDGEDYTSRASLEDVVREAHRLNVTISPVGTLSYRLKDSEPEHWLGSRIPIPKYRRYWGDRLRRRGVDFLRRQAEETGGLLYLPKYTTELPEVFEHIVLDLKSAYSLAYYPSNTHRDGEFRRVEVRTTRPDVKTRTRRGYYGSD